jgi:hypothetical protein
METLEVKRPSLRRVGKGGNRQNVGWRQSTVATVL